MRDYELVDKIAGALGVALVLCAAALLYGGMLAFVCWVVFSMWRWVMG